MCSTSLSGLSANLLTSVLQYHSQWNKYSPPPSLHCPIVVAQTLSPSILQYSPQSHKRSPPPSLHCLPIHSSANPHQRLLQFTDTSALGRQTAASKLSPLLKLGFLSMWFLPGSSSFASAAKVVFLPCKGEDGIMVLGLLCLFFCFVFSSPVERVCL